MLRRQENKLNYLKSYLGIALISYIVLSLYYAVIGYKDEIPQYMELARIFFLLDYVLMVSLAFTRIKSGNLFVLNSFFVLVTVILVKLFYLNSGVDVFGGARDPYVALEYTFTKGTRSLGEFLDADGLINRFNRADFAFYGIFYTLYNIYPDKLFIVYGLVVINCIAVLISSFMLYRLQMRLVPNDVQAKVITMLYNSSPFVLSTVANGMKEVMFLAIIITAMYYIVKLHDKFNWLDLGKCLLVIFMARYFRSSLDYMLLVSLIVSITANEKNKRIYIIVLLATFLLLSSLLPVFITHVLGMDLEEIIKVAEYRMEQADTRNSLFVQVIPYLSALIGPFAQLDRSGNYAFMHSAFIFLKSAMSLFFILGVYRIVVLKSVRYFSILTFVFLSVYMVVVAGVSLDIRYHLIYLPFFFIIAVNWLKPNRKLDYLYLTTCVLLVILYTTREI